MDKIIHDWDFYEQGWLRNFLCIEEDYVLVVRISFNSMHCIFYSPCIPDVSKDHYFELWIK